MVSHGHVTVARNTHGNNSGQLFTAYDCMRDETGFIWSDCWAAAGQHLQKLLLAVGGGWADGAASCDGAALSLLDWEGGHHGQILGERRFLEPAPSSSH